MTHDDLMKFPGLAALYIERLTATPTPPAPCGTCGAATHYGCELCARDIADRALSAADGAISQEERGNE